MGKAYVMIQNNKVCIGNDYIERVFSIENNKVRTTEIRNKRIGTEKCLKCLMGSSDFCVGFRKKKFIGEKTEFVFSNELNLEKINKNEGQIQFIFKPYKYNMTEIIFSMNIEIKAEEHFMHKYIDMKIKSETKNSIFIDYIDCEHIKFEKPDMMWTIGNIEEAYLSKYHSALGQPFYINGLFFGSEFPLCENNIKDDVAFIRYFSGKSFDKLKLIDDNTYRTWPCVTGAARSYEHEVIREDFLTYIRSISRKVKPRFQYNSWYDHMLDISDENISKSFNEIEKNLDKTLVPPLDSYVVDDGFVDYKSDFWNFNKKFPNEFYPASKLVKKFSSNFGVWIGPRGGYNKDTPGFGIRMNKAGTGGYNKEAMDVCVASKSYIKNITNLFIDFMDRFDVNYWKLDGFLLKACHNKHHGHMVGGYHDMYEYTDMWEDWIDIFNKIRSHREKQGKDLWINQTSYCNASPWFLQWADSFWIQNSTDIGYLDKTKSGEKLSEIDFNKILSYRDDRYYDFSVVRDYQFPHEYIYNHDPIYGNTAKIKIKDEEYRQYMFMMATRGNAFWELYYSYNLFNDAKWRINSDCLRFIRNEYNILRTSRCIGGTPANGEIYGYSAWNESSGIVSLRNPTNRVQEYSIKLDRILGTYEGCQNLKRIFILPYDKEKDEKIYSYGDEIKVTLRPLEIMIMKFSSEKEKTPSLIYGRFNSANELFLFFDNRIYFCNNSILCDKQIKQTELLEDYSTLKITFNEKIDDISLKMQVSNSLGNDTTIDFQGVFYPDFICPNNRIPSCRDFTLMFNISNNYKSGELLKVENILDIFVNNGIPEIHFLDKKSVGSTVLKNKDNLAVVCEPNGIIKLYINGELECSVYKSNIIRELQNAEVYLSDNSENLKILSKALSYDEF